MKKIKLIHTGDIHLGLKFKNANFKDSFANQRRLEIWDTFEKIIDRCYEKNVDILLMAGDIFEEEYFTISDIRRLESNFEKIKDTKVVIIAGNHDPVNNSSLYNSINWSENVYIIKENRLKSIELEELDTTIWGLSWDKKEERENLLRNIYIEDDSKINILLAHGDIYNKDSNYMPINIDTLIESKFNYIALGHIHKHEFINERIAYSGSPEPLDFGEQGEHGIIEGEISKEETNMKFVPISKREFVQTEITIDENMNYHQIIDTIVHGEDEQDRFKNLYRMTISGMRNSDIEIDEGMIKTIKDKFTHIEIIDNTIPDYDLDKIYNENEKNIIGHFIKDMKEKNLENKIIRRALYLGLEALLSEKVIL